LLSGTDLARIKLRKSAENGLYCGSTLDNHGV
jgi:hypothetical protein